MNRLKELRLSKKLTQSDVAKAISTAQQNYSRYENETAQPDFETLKKLANFFNVTIDYILGKEASDLILLSKEDFNKLKEASEIIQKIDKAYHQKEATIITGDIKGNNITIAKDYNKKINTGHIDGDNIKIGINTTKK